MNFEINLFGLTSIEVLRLFIQAAASFCSSAVP